MIANIQQAATLSHAARNWLPPARTGNPVHPSVLTRWSDRGIVARSGERIFLHTWRVGGQRMVTQAAIEEFLEALNAGSPASDDLDDDSVSRRAHEASSALERLGC
ncbi:DUF1580 domain-containing protein [Schlesneria sp. DSM 10557]|uniref:DUF1580 domain-containing protein n=1 Tax=Schlesneria sp. DSM 10557 TaxID=3044399 RepID=UPI0035A13D42